MQCEEIEKFDRVILIGTTNIYRLIERFLCSKSEISKLCLIEYNNTTGEAKCTKWDSVIKNEEVNIEEVLLKLEDNSLIINAGSYYIYPEKLISKKNFYILNYHNAILPYYKGLNATTWMIYYNEKYAGITWHKVEKKIDTGRIIIQEKLEITKFEKAYELLARQNKLAYEKFCECWESWYKGDFSQKILNESYNKYNKGKLFLGKEIPNQGLISFTENSSAEIARIICSMDYGKVKLFGDLKIRYKENEEIIKRYKISSKIKNNTRYKYELKLDYDKYLYIETTKEEEND